MYKIKTKSGSKIVLEDVELSYLKEHFPYEAACDIADHLGVSAPFVCRLARELGLEKDSGFRKSAYTNRYVSRYKNLQTNRRCML